MVLVVQIFAAFMALFGLVGLLAPGKLLGMIKALFEWKGGLIVVVGLRLLIGALLIVTAPSSRFPSAFQIIGGIVLLAAVVGIFIGRERASRLVEWFLAKPPGFIRVRSLLAIAFGVFIYRGLA